MIAYLNDILIYLKTKKKHIKHVTAVLETLEKADIRINSAKNIFYVQRVNFLGYIFITNRIKINLIKIAIIKDWPTLKNMTKI
jgi:Reverse transcriptase (RNA-dependent DNA polymerase)